MVIEQLAGRRPPILRRTLPRFAGRAIIALLTMTLTMSASSVAAARTHGQTPGAAAGVRAGRSVRLVGVLLDAGGGSPARLKVGERYGYQIDVIPIHTSTARMAGSGSAAPQTNPRLVFRFVGLARWASMGAAGKALCQGFCRRSFRARWVRLDNGWKAVDFGPCSVVRLSFTPTRIGHQHLTVEAEAVTISHGTYRVRGTQGSPLTWAGVVKR